VGVRGIFGLRMVVGRVMTVERQTVDELNSVGSNYATITTLLQQETMHSRRFIEILDELKVLHESKNKDYGTINLVGEFDPLGNLKACTRLGLSPIVGVAVRLVDKMARLESFIRRGELTNESVEDTLRDMAVYSILAIVLLESELQG